MFKPIASFSGFSVNNLDAARDFYRRVLELEVQDEMGGLRLHLPGRSTAFVYVKNDHQPAAYTALNFVVVDIDEAVAELQRRGILFERYEGMDQDEHGIMRGKEVGRGPNIAWFKDPAGNILSVLEA